MAAFDLEHFSLADIKFLIPLSFLPALDSITRTSFQLFLVLLLPVFFYKKLPMKYICTYPQILLTIPLSQLLAEEFIKQKFVMLMYSQSIYIICFWMHFELSSDDLYQSLIIHILTQVFQVLENVRYIDHGTMKFLTPILILLGSSSIFAINRRIPKAKVDGTPELSSLTTETISPRKLVTTKKPSLFSPKEDPVNEPKQKNAIEEDFIPDDKLSLRIEKNDSDLNLEDKSDLSSKSNNFKGGGFYTFGQKPKDDLSQNRKSKASSRRNSHFVSSSKLNIKPTKSRDNRSQDNINLPSDENSAFFLQKLDGYEKTTGNISDKPKWLLTIDDLDDIVKGMLNNPTLMSQNNTGGHEIKKSLANQFQ